MDPKEGEGCEETKGGEAYGRFGGMPMEVKKSSITSRARSCRTIDPRRFWELQVSACVLVFSGESGAEPHDMQRPLVLRPCMGM
jgi:hypothetical protein